MRATTIRRTARSLSTSLPAEWHYKCGSTYRSEPAARSTVRGSPLWSAALIQTDAIPGEWCCARIKAQSLLKVAPKLRPNESQLFLKWGLGASWRFARNSRSEAEHPFLRVKLLSWWRKWVTAASNQASGSKSLQHREEKSVRSLEGMILARAEHPRSFHPSVLSGCFPSSSPPPAHRLETAGESEVRAALRTPTCESHSRCDPLLPGRRCPAQLV